MLACASVHENPNRLFQGTCSLARTTFCLLRREVCLNAMQDPFLVRGR